MHIATLCAFEDELEKLAAVIPMVSHYEVTLDENGKATGLSDTIQQLAHLPGGLRTVRTPADEELEKTSGEMEDEKYYTRKSKRDGTLSKLREKTSTMTKLSAVEVNPAVYNVFLHGRSRKAGKTPADYNPNSVQKGARVEQEHSADNKVQKRIAADHLQEDPRYYEKLEKMENGYYDKLEREKKASLSLASRIALAYSRT
jgi:hypothetical protein